MRKGAARGQVTLPGLRWNQRCCILDLLCSLAAHRPHKLSLPPLLLLLLPPHLPFLTVTYTYTVGHFSGGRLLSLQPGRMQTWRGLLCSRGLCTCQSVCEREATSETCTTSKPSSQTPHKIQGQGTRGVSIDNSPVEQRCFCLRKNRSCSAQTLPQI